MNADWIVANQRWLAAALDLLRARLEGADTEYEAQRWSAAARNMPAPSALERLADAFGLTGFECDIVLLCAGFELDADFAAFVAGCAAGTGRPSFALALGRLPEAHWSALAPGGPLRHWHLIERIGHPADTLTSGPLRIDERILHYLAGIESLDAGLVGLVEPVLLSDRAALPESHAAVAERAALLWERQPEGARWPILCLCGPDSGGDKRAIAATVAETLGLRLFTLSTADIPGSALERDNLARLWDREAALTGGALLLTTDDADALRGLGAFWRRLQGAVFLASPTPPPPGTAPVLHLEVPTPRAAEQAALWSAALGAEKSPPLDRLAAQFRLGGEAVRDAVRAAATAETGDLSAALWAACRAQTRPRLDDLAQRIDLPPGTPRGTEDDGAWDELVLPAPLLKTLAQIVAQVQHQATVYEDWGFGRVSARGLGVSALFHGASGTGKTLAAEVLARKLDLDLYRIDLATVVSKYIGETEKNLKRIFDAAEYGGAILLFDEADALFGKRSEVRDSHDRYANIEVSYLLQRMEAYRGLALLTTNVRSALDTAFLRRLRFVVAFPFPGPDERARLWSKIFPDEVPTDALDFGRLARLNVAGGNIRNIALGAAFLAAAERCPVRMEHLRAATVTEYAKLDQAFTDDEVRIWPEANR